MTELKSFYDARVVNGHLALARCGGIRVLDAALTKGRDVPLVAPDGGCVALIGSAGKTLVVHVDGRGLLGIDSGTGEVAWSAPIQVGAPCSHPTVPAGSTWTDPKKLAGAGIHLTEGPLTPQWPLAVTGAHTCAWVVLSGTTLVSWEASGKLVGRSAERGDVRWEEGPLVFDKRSRLVADGTGHVVSTLRAGSTIESFAALTGTKSWEKHLASSELLEMPLVGLSDGVYLASRGAKNLLLDGATGEERDSSRLVGDVTFVGTTPLSVGHADASYDALSVYATDDRGRLVAYRREDGKPEGWSYGILAVGLDSRLEPTYATPRVEWLGSTEVLIGLGVADDGAPVLSLFRKAAVVLDSRRVHVRGTVEDARMSDGLHVKVGSQLVDVHSTKTGGTFEADLEGRGALRASFLEGGTPESEVAPSSLTFSFERGPAVDLRFHVFRSSRDKDEEPRETGEPEAAPCPPQPSTCPVGEVRSASGCAAPACESGRQRAQGASGCCWPGQRYLGACTGAPTSCPPGMQASETDCVRVAPAGMVAIPGNTFRMGARGDTVTVRSFFVDANLVTANEYTACVRAGVCTAPSSAEPTCNYRLPQRQNHPINCVDWSNAVNYCQFVGKRLPSEEEWELAARGGDEGRLYPWGDSPPDEHHLCWHIAEQDVATCPVGSFPAGDARGGVHDMAGNVAEWTLGGRCVGETRIARGGGSSARAEDLRASARQEAVSSAPVFGLRCAK